MGGVRSGDYGCLDPRIRGIDLGADLLQGAAFGYGDWVTGDAVDREGQLASTERLAAGKRRSKAFLGRGQLRDLKLHTAV